MDFLQQYWSAILMFIFQSGFLTFAYKFYKKWREQMAAEEAEIRKREEARDIATRSLLRTEIIGIYHKAEEKGFLPIYNLENLDDMYHAYKALGGNGAITELYNQVKNYPHNNPPGH